MLTQQPFSLHQLVTADVMGRDKKSILASLHLTYLECGRRNYSGLLNLCDTATQVPWILPTCVTVWLAAGNPATRLTAPAPSVWPSNWPSDTWITLYVTWDTEQTWYTENLSSAEVQILLGIKTDYLPFGLTLINSFKLDNEMISHLPTCSFCLENILDGLVAEGGRRLNGSNCCWILSCGYGPWRNKVF